jgi:hypothetical protein
MIDIAVSLAPLRFAACALCKMTFLRFHNARIALSESLKTGIAIALIKTFFSQSVAVHAVDIPQKIQTE